MSIVYRDPDGRIVSTPRSTKSLELDDLPLPARDLIDLSAYRGTFYKKGTCETSVLAARGCPWSCTYCGPAWRWAMERPRFRHRSVKSLVDELEMVHETYGADDILLMIDTLNSNVRWAAELCREIIDRGLKLNLKVHVRADFLTPELLGLMRKAGFWLVYMGIETANDRTLRGVRKQLTVAQIEHALTAIRDADIKVVAELMNCLFWEEDGVLVHEGLSDALRTLRFARRMFAKGLIQAMYWSPMMPLPASDSYRIAVKHELILDEVKGKWHLWFPVQRPVVRLTGVGAPKWYFIQWLGKVHQTYFLTASGLLHRSRRRLVAKRLL